jgi:hypothetical protein
VGAFLLHTLTASAGLVAPLAAVRIGGDRARTRLERLRAAIARHNATVMAVVLGALGLYVILDAVLKP